ncbi:hypothetical protein ACSU64_11335 [Bacillaceae bacterium C204]|uniref:hypothetical protein n=1 Tax=Neobacillus sp. 204 TaxID=3383351 RepID=UPI00397A5DD1
MQPAKNNVKAHKSHSIDDYDDVSAKNMYRLKRADGIPHEDIMEIIWASGRDNSVPQCNGPKTKTLVSALENNG